MSIYRQCTFSSSGEIQGRPIKNFEDSSFKTKKRRVENLVKLQSATELTTAAEVACRALGHRNQATLIRKSLESSEKIKSKDFICDGRQLNCDKALAYYIDSKCTSHSYKQKRKWSLKAGHILFPSYYSLC